MAPHYKRYLFLLLVLFSPSASVCRRSHKRNLVSRCWCPPG